VLARLVTCLATCAVVVAASWLHVTGAAAEAPARTRPHWDWPIAPAVIVRPYVAPETLYGRGHRGLDLEATPGTVLRMPFDGQVSFVGRVVDRTVVTVTDGSDWSLSMEPVESRLVLGDRVSRGSSLGRVGAGPHCGCVHVGVRWRGMYVNPLLVFGSLPRAILLPW
jgi:hypothetical protein